MSDDIAPNEEQMLAAEYVLGLLTPDEATAFEALMEVDGDARASYARWAEDFVGMTDDIAPVDPPEALLQQIKAAAFGTAAMEPPAEAPEQAAPAPQRQSLLERLGLLPAIGGGLIAAAVALWAINPLIGPLLDPPATATVLLASADESLVVEVGYVEDSGNLEVTRTAGAAPEGQVLELWVIKGDGPPVSLGVLPTDETGTLVVAETLWPLLRGAQCAISIEPPGGSPTGAPTGDIVAVAPIVWQA
ncbi:anti-sigma factor [Yoonia sp. R2331]|uniref:anti-sigma factor n=1 Tax=Yoonia sp. R2331 TaxID=3237238 RepID=UPI0034E463B9